MFSIKKFILQNLKIKHFFINLESALQTALYVGYFIPSRVCDKAKMNFYH
jgi:hypothetical protein